MDNDEFDDDGDIPEDIEDMDYMLTDEWTTNISKTNSMIFFKEKLALIQNENPHLYQIISSSLNTEEIKKLEEIVSSVK